MFNLRHEIYVAGTEKVIDEQKLAKLVQQDKSYNMEDYANILLSARDAGPARTKKLLNLPGVDQTSPAYKRAAADTYRWIASNVENPNLKILNMLLEKFKDEQPLIEKTLTGIFKTVADGYEQPSEVAAKMLVENGADSAKAMSKDKEYFTGQRRSANRALARLRDFNSKLSGP